MRLVQWPHQALFPICKSLWPRQALFLIYKILCHCIQSVSDQPGKKNSQNCLKMSKLAVNLQKGTKKKNSTNNDDVLRFF